MYCLRRSRFLRSTGRKVAKSLLARASTQTGIASADERDISARSSDGTLRAFCQSRRATRTRLASNESYSCCCSSPARSSSRRPTSSDVNFSCAIRPTVASCSARAGAPRGGIIVCWSHASTAPALPRSAISCSRVTSSSKRESLTAGNVYEARGGPEGKLRGRPPPPVEPRSGPWRRTGSEFDAGRAQTRRELSMTDGPGVGLASDAKRRRKPRRARRVHRRAERDAEGVAAGAEARREARDLRAVRRDRRALPQYAMRA